jgi:E3 ubiquitin-protein ligase UBR3
MTYIQANFCNSMVDMDLFFLQICATQLPSNFFLSACIDNFSVTEWFFQNLSNTQEMEHDSMMEGMLTFLATLVTSRTNLGNDEDMKCIVEISALLTTSDKTHSQLLELMPERSGNPYAKNFEKYLKLLSSYRPPPVGSENLEQGLFIPLPVVWKIYYDPLHVLLRAVHRRDFQNSMDRFSAFVRQQNKMPKSGNLWPPFRLPNNVGNGYSDPACILNTKVFHSMILGILYRAVHVRNVSENLMALAIFLLELAVTKTSKECETSALECTPKSNSSNSSYSMEQNNMMPELFNCYPSNNLYENLCLHVCALSLKKQETQNSPANYQSPFDSDIEFELSESDPMPMLIGSVDHDYAYNGGLDVAVPQDLSIVRENSTLSNDDLSPTPPSISRNHQLLPLMGPESAIVEYNSNTAAVVEQRQQLAIDSVPATTAENTNMELVVRQPGPNRSPQELFYSSVANINMANAILPFNRVQPVAVPSSTQTMEVVPATANPQLNHTRRRMRNLESNDAATDAAIKIDDSIISLLLKLHSQLSGTLDSFSLDDSDAMSDDNDDIADCTLNASSHHYPNSSEQRIGDGPFFIGNLLRKIARADDRCARNINEIRQTLWPNQRERQAEQKAREAKEKEERTKRARERQQKLMEEFANRQKQFMATEGKLMEGIGEDDNDVEAREKEYDCIICNCTGPSTDSNPIGLVVLVESSSIVGHRRKTPNRFPLPVCDEDKEISGRNVRLSSEFKKRAEVLGRKYGTQWFLTHNICWEGGVHVQSCGHHVHLTCHESYLKSLAPTRPQNLNIEHGEFSCPRCRQLANSVLPLSPQLDRPTTLIRNPTPKFDQLCVEFMDLIKDSIRQTVS